MAAGGGAYVSSKGTVDRCVIAQNQAGNGGGIAFMLGLNAQAVNCLIVSNEASWCGGATYLYRGGSLINCTLAGNTATNGPGGAGINFDGTGPYTNFVVNSIVYHNTGTELVMTDMLNYVSYSCIATNIPGVGNITNEPLFAGMATGDYRLAAGSPCINTGTNLPWMAGATDLDGNPRNPDGMVDMGCYEVVPEPAAAGVAAIVSCWLVVIRRTPSTHHTKATS